MIARFALACVLGGCTVPTLECANSIPAVDGRCAYPAHAIAIDGDLSDWSDVPTASCPGCTCANCTGPGDVVTMRATATTDGKLALLAQTNGPPVNVTYVLALATYDGPSLVLNMFASPSEAASEGTNFPDEFTGLPIAFAFSQSPLGTTGIELAIDLDALPFAGGALAFGGISGTQAYPTIQACWDPTVALCQPH